MLPLPVTHPGPTPDQPTPPRTVWGHLGDLLSGFFGRGKPPLPVATHPAAVRPDRPADSPLPPEPGDLVPPDTATPADDYSRAHHHLFLRLLEEQQKLDAQYSEARRKLDTHYVDEFRKLGESYFPTTSPPADAPDSSPPPDGPDSDDPPLFPHQDDDPVRPPQQPVAQTEPPARSHSLPQFGTAADFRGWAEAAAAAIPTDAAQAGRVVAGWLWKPPGRRSSAAAEAIADWFAKHPQAASAAQVEVVRPSALPANDRAGVQWEAGGEWAEVRGFRVGGQEVDWRPAVRVPETAAGQLAAKAWATLVPPLGWAEAGELAAGQLTPELAARVVGWLDHHDVDQLAARVLAGRPAGVQVVDQPVDKVDLRFETTILHRQSDGLCWVVRPAYLVAGRTNPKPTGKAHWGVPLKLPLSDFIHRETFALREQVRSREWLPFQLARDRKLTPLDISKLVVELSAHREKLESNPGDPFITGLNFGRFVQDVLRVVLFDAGKDGEDWRRRQASFQAVAEEYLRAEARDWSLERASPGESGSKFDKKFECYLALLPEHNPNRVKNGLVVATLVPALLQDSGVKSMGFLVSAR